MASGLVKHMKSASTFMGFARSKLKVSVSKVYAAKSHLEFKMFFLFKVLIDNKLLTAKEEKMQGYFNTLNFSNITQTLRTFKYD